VLATSTFNPLSAAIPNIAYRRLCPARPEATPVPAPSIKARAAILVDRTAVLACSHSIRSGERYPGKSRTRASDAAHAVFPALAQQMLLWLTKEKRQSRSVRRDFVTFRAVPFHVFNKPAIVRWDRQIVL
jgi:hypothetical protein